MSRCPSSLRPTHSASYFSSGGDDGDFPADAAEVRPILRDKLALASLLGEGEHLLKMGQHGGDKLGSARYAAELGNRARDLADVLRPRRIGGAG